MNTEYALNALTQKQSNNNVLWKRTRTIREFYQSGRSQTLYHFTIEIKMYASHSYCGIVASSCRNLSLHFVKILAALVAIESNTLEKLENVSLSFHVLPINGNGTTTHSAICSNDFDILSFFFFGCSFFTFAYPGPHLPFWAIVDLSVVGFFRCLFRQNLLNWITLSAVIGTARMMTQMGNAHRERTATWMVRGVDRW